MADSIQQLDELRAAAELPRERALSLLRRRSFRRAYTASSISTLGDAFQFIALMWLALEMAGPLGILLVRIVDSIPSILLLLHGGVVADRFDRRKTMIAADLTRFCVLVPTGVAGLTGHLPLWGLALSGFVVSAAMAYFSPASAALLPALVSRRNVQQAGAFVTATNSTLHLVGWALGAALLIVLPISSLFLINAASFLASAALLSSLHISGRGRRQHVGEAPIGGIREGLAALRKLPEFAVGVSVLALAMTIHSGVMIVGMPTFVRDELGAGPAGWSLVLATMSLGTVAAAIACTRWQIERKVLWSILLWGLASPAFLLFATADALWIVAIGGLIAVGPVPGALLLRSSAQEQVPDRVLGRMLSFVDLAGRGSKGVGLILIAPLLTVVEPRSLFFAAALVVPLLVATGAYFALTRDRGAVAPAPALGRSLQL